ncbi:hypothetical protein ACHRVW_23160 [Flavobacterium collinsii]|jgi:hypothetical protein|uniref:hypothetical protein n=1 Tax=Flavobacterium collinsii TaxID=1114861 RepID=UPI0037569DCE
MPFQQFITNLFGVEENTNTNTFAANQLLLTAFLQNSENAQIRIYVPASPGYGHQANTVNIMYSLIAAGFNQDIQMIYDDTETVPTNIVKLATLIPGLDPINPEPVDINENVTVYFISTTNFATTPQDQLVFGITGGYDDSATNLALLTKTSIFLKLQPYCWREVNSLYINRGPGEENQTIINLSDVEVLGNFIFTRQNYYLPVPQMSETDYEQFTTATPAKVPPYRAILEASTGENPTINMMPVYGLGDLGGMIESMGARPESVLFNLLASVARTQRYGDAEHLKKGAVIVVIATITEPCYTNLIALLAGQNAEVPDLNAYILQENLDNRVDIIDYNAEDFGDQLAAVAASNQKILLVKMNGLPGAPFNYMYSKSTLPCVFEGKGTASLVLNLPLPFFNLTNSNLNRRYVYPTLPLQNIKILQAETAASAQAITCNTTTFRLIEAFATTNTKLHNAGIEGTALYTAAQFMQNAYTPDNPINTYLAGLSHYFHQQQNDKLTIALLYMLNYTKDIN